MRSGKFYFQLPNAKKIVKGFAMSNILLAIALLSSTVVRAQYCSTGTDNGCTFGDQYSSFSTSGGATNISHTPGGTCEGDANGYAAFSGAGLSASATIGTTISTSITAYSGGFTPGYGYAIWIDWNQNNTFETSEMVYSSAGMVSPGATDVGSFTVPAGAVFGSTKLRVRFIYNLAGSTLDPCTFYSGANGYGVTFDYPFTVLSAAPVCTPGTTNGCAFGDQYSSFSTGGGATNISHSPGGTCVGDANGYASLSGAGSSASAARGTPMTTSVTNYAGDFAPGQGFAIWIDWNHDNTFQSTEQVYASSGILAPGATDPGSFTVPTSAYATTTTLRIRSHYNNAGTTIDPCTFYSGGTDGYGISFDFPFTVLGVSFVNGNSQSLTVCKNASATSINSLLKINDPTASLTETWSIATAPTHGTLGGFPATATSTGGNVTPTGLTYTPTAGYSGSDPFVIQVSDGSSTVTTTVNVTVSAPNLTTFTMSASAVCPGSGSVVTVNPTSLADGLYTVNYTLSGATSATGSYTMNVVSGSGTFTTSALNSGFTSITLNSVVNSDGCSNTAFFSTGVSTLPLPTVYNVGGGGNYCSGGTGVHVTLAATGPCCPPSGVNYQLYIGGIASGAPVPGAFSGIDFGLQTVAGTYTVIATNASTTCSVNMSGSAVVGINPLPSQYTLSVSNGGHYCSGGTGVIISTNGSTSGDNYQLYRGITAVGAPIGGSGLPISFPAQTVAGTYSVKATTSATGCQQDMFNTVNVVVDPLPTVYNVTVTNSGHYCSGGSGVTIGLDGSEGTVNYQLYRGATAVGAPVTGTGGIISFPAQTVAGTYTVTGTNATTTCTINMFGSATVTIDPLPNPIGGNTPVCVGQTVSFTETTAGGSWSSVSPSVATVGSGTGIVTGVSGGNSTIVFTVLATGCSASTVATVNALPTSITGAGSVCVNSSITLASTPSGGTWSSSAPGQATVTAGGVVTGLSAGLPTITYANGTTGCYTTTPVTVNPLPAAIGGPNAVCVGSIINLTDATGSGTWSSNNLSLATVTVGGNVTGVANGAPTISYTISTGCAATLTITVNPLPSNITGSLTVCVGLSTPLSDPSGSGTWVSGNLSAATVGSTSGTVYGVAPGTSSITFTLPTGCATSSVVTVNSVPGSISGNSPVCVNGTIGLSDGGGGTWSSNDLSKATVGSTTGIVTGVASGNPTITYTVATGCYNTTILTVNPIPAGITGPNIVCVGASINLGETSSGGAWTSSNMAVATVGTSGTVYGVAAGSTLIDYTLPTGCLTTYSVSVNTSPAPISGNAPVCQGSTLGLSDAGGGLWTSNDLTKVTIGSASGVVTALASPGTTVTYTLGTGCYQTAFVTVNPVPLPIGGATFSVCTGSQITLTDATGGGTWSSSNLAMATVGSSGINAGVVSGLSIGSPVISYIMPTGCYAIATITVNQTPPAIGGNVPLCTGSTITLTDATSGGTWSSSNGAQATVNSSTGVVIGGSGPSNPVITYTMPSGCSISTTLTVNAAPSSITSSGAMTVCVNGNILLTDATSGGTWSSSNLALATVVPSGGLAGTVYGVSQGVPVITYTSSTGCIATAAVTVNPLPAAISGATAVCTGSSIGLSDATPGGSWSSSNNSWATVGSSTGVVNGLVATTSPTISYILPTGCLITSVITVNQTPSNISGALSVCVNGNTVLTDATPGGTWSSSNLAEATVISSGGGAGTVYGVTAGTPTITYSIPGTGCYATYTITVNPLPAGVTGSSTVCTGGIVGLGDSSPGGTWSSSNTAQASVGSVSGVVTGGATSGTVNIIYTLATGCTTTWPMTVNPSPAVITGAPSVCVNASTVLSDGTPGGNWSSSNLAEATVVPSGGLAGTVYGVAAGAPVITYLMPITGCYSTYVITVNPLPSAISGPNSVCETATITLSDAGGGTWSSSNPGWASINSATGVVTGVSAAGNPTITYTLSTGCTQTKLVTVNPQPANIAAGTGNVCSGLTLNLTDATPGGTWSSTNASIASVGSTGIVTGGTAGTVTIVYTLPAGCSTSTVITVNPLPSSISGANSVCELSSITLTDAGGGTWASSNPAWATVNSATGVVTGVSAAGNPTITYALSTGCIMTKVITVNPQPAAISGVPVVCTGANILLSDATTGGNWSSSNLALATVVPSGGLAGTVYGVAAGNPVISYTLPAGCYSTVIATVNTSPAAITGVMSVCVGLTTTLNDATTGGNWSSLNTSQATVGSTTGVVTGVAPGNPTIVYTTPNGCTTGAVITVNLTPAPIGGATPIVCAGSTITLTDGTPGGAWSSSNASVATVGTGGVVMGVAAGTATIAYATGAGCSVSVIVTVNPIPNISSFTSPTATNVCTGSGSTVTVNSSSLGSGTYTVTYNLSGANTATGSTAVLTMGPTNGTFNISGPALSGLGTTTITITAIANSFGCTSTVSSSNTVTITTYPLPTPFIVGGGGGYCSGGSGVHITLSGSLGGNTYQLYKGATAVGGPLTGTFSGLDFGLVTAVGTYSVTATNTTTGCQNGMTGTVTVFVNPLPSVYSITGGGGYCFGGTGVAIGVSNSDTGVNYQLYNGVTAVGGPVAGTGAALSFGLQTAAGTYTVVATRPSTGCQSTMTGTATITINPVPSAISGTAYACPGTSSTLGSAPSGGTWSSSTLSIATVGSTTGVVWGVANGVSTITYTLPTGCYTTIPVTINPLPAGITGTPNVCVGLTNTLLDASGGGTWSSANTLIANINITTGLVTGMAAGTTTIVYTLPTGCSMSTAFTVNPTPAAIGGNAPLCSGLSMTLTDATSGGVWSSSNTSVATVASTTGIVTGVGVGGTATITYTLPAGCTATAIVTINPSPATISGPNNVCTSTTVSLSDGISGGVWSSSNTTLATVNSSTGAVTGLAAGSPNITYTLPAGCFAIQPMTVNTSPAGITGASSVCTGSATTLADATTGGVWSSGSTGVATVGSTTGVVNGVTAGSANITYTVATGCTAVTSIVVNQTPSAIGGPNNVCVNSTINLTNTYPSGVWSSSNAALATAGASSGTIGGVAAGSPTITYVLPGGCYSTLQITVNTTPASITGSNNVCVGSLVALSDANAGGTWTSSNTSVASVGSTTGIVSGILAGNTTITYTLNPGSCVATFPMTVNPVPAAITGVFNVCVTSTTTLGDGTTGGVWSSSNASLATVGAFSGTVGGVATGTPVISYTLPTGCSATQVITVNPLPGPITGPSAVCTSNTINLNDATTGGTWSSSNLSAATVNSATGVVYGVAVGSTTITYLLPTGCYMTTTIVVNQTPAAITGTNNICVGQSNTLADATGGGIWSSSNSSLATIGSTSGTVLGVATGYPVITYTLPAGCFSIYPVTVNPTPGPITGTASVCTGNITTLADASTGGTWSSSNTSQATVGSISGIVSGIAAGLPVITYTLPAGCNTTVVVTVNQTPSAILGVTNVCVGSTVNLTDSITGGTWSSSNSSIALANSLTGAISGMSAGLVTITYTLPAGCFTTASFTVNPLPTAITGTRSVCVGLTTTLNSTPAGGTWSSSSTSSATVGSLTGIVTGVVAGTPNITYTLPTGCIATATVTVNALPTPYLVTGGGAYCVGGTGLHIYLSSSNTGISYQLKNGATSVGSPLSGTGTGLDFGIISGAGTYTVVATNTITGCTNNMTGSAIILVNPLPNPYNITGGGAYCPGTTGVTVGLNGSDAGINYQLYNTSTSAYVGSVVAGTGSAISFGLVLTTGNYVVVATNPITSCTQNMLGTAVVSVAPVPTAYTVTGGGAYCAGGIGVTVGLSNSQSGVNYQLYYGASPVGFTVPGTGSAISFPAVTSVGTYTISGTYSTSGGCSSGMFGSATVSVNPTPTVYAVTTPGGTSFCLGSVGVSIGVANSQTGVNYQILNGTTAIGAPVAGTTGVAITIGFVSPVITTTYNVVAVNTTTGCTSTMSGSAVLTPSPLPAVQTITGGGSYCSGGSGVPVGLANSVTGVTYQLQKPGGGTTNVGGTTGSAINFGNQTLAGTYTVIAWNTATPTCTVNMFGSVGVTINPPPLAFSVTGGGSYCAGGTGVHIMLSGSISGTTYQLYNGATPVGSPLTGTGSGLDFGLITIPSTTYNVVATVSSTLCTATMPGTITVATTALPTAYAVGGGGSYCAGGTGVAVTLLNSQTGVSYQLFNGASPAGIPVAGTGSGISFGLQTTPGVYTVFATNPTTTCTNNMTGSVSVTITSAPAVNNVSGGGNYCAGGAGLHVMLDGSSTANTYQLYRGATFVGSPVTGTGSALDFGLLTPAGTYTVVATGITSGCTSNMTGSATIVVNPLPTVHNVTGGGSFCSGGSGLHIGLDGSDIGITYQLYYGIVPMGTVVAGTGSAIDFGLQTLVGSYTVVATNFFTGCTANMAGSANVIMNTLPNVYTTTGGGSYCPGGSGVLVGLTPSDTGVNYQLYLAGTAAGPMVAGTGGSISFGMQTGVGAYGVVATNASTGCTDTMAGTVTVSLNTVPTAYAVTGGGSYCTGGAGLNIGLSNSASGINYQLYKGVTAVGSPVAGLTGFPISFGMKTAAGVYTVMATNATTGCTSNMTGSVTISIQPLPVVYTVTGGGSYCSGGAGVQIGMNTTDTGITYQLYKGLATVGSPVAGTGTTLDFGAFTASGVYTVVATNSSTGCVNNMAGSATISINPNPAPYIVAGSGSYCAGGTGVDVHMGGSDMGINYQLYNGITTVGAPVAGTSFPISFGPQTAAGTYTVVAINAVTGCSSNMLDSAVVVMNAVPVTFTVSGGGTYCPDATGIHINLSGSDTGISYQLYNGGLSSGSPIVGSGSVLDWSFISVVNGHYTVVAHNMSTGCSSLMAGSADIATYPVPTAYNMTGGGNYCSGGSGVNVGLFSSDTGVSYQLYNGVTAMGSPVPGTGLPISFGMQTAAGTYTVVARSNSTSCTNHMTGSAIVTINTLPTAYTIMSSTTSYCVGSLGVDITLSGSQTGVSYQLFNGLTPVGIGAPGTGGPLDFGVQPFGTYIIVATNTSTGCTNNMTGSLVINVNPLPAMHTVTGGGGYCAGGTGTHVYLDGSDAGVNYQLYDGFVPAGGSVAGTGGGLDFGLQTSAGVYKVVATDGTTGCVANMASTATVSINPLPTAYPVTGGGAFCYGGTGVHVGLGNSQTGVNYQLYRGLVSVGAALPGTTGSGIDFGLQTGSGSYTVVATNATTGCQQTMSGSASVSVNTLPTAYSVVGGGNYCAGGTGVHVGLSGSDTGVTYMLVRDGSPLSSLAGTGAAIDFGLETVTGTYTITGTRTSTGCAANMTGSTVITISALPGAFTITGGGSYCPSTSGVEIDLSGSEVGVNYQLYNGVAAVGGVVPGTGGSISFGVHTAGIYTAVAINATTGCTSNMTGSATSTMAAAVVPSVTITTGVGDTVCSGTLVNFTALATNGGSTPTFQWYVNGVPVGSGSNYSYVPTNGNIITVSMNSTATCAMPATVTGTLTITVLPYVTPSVYISANPGDTVCQGTPITFIAHPVYGGTAPTYTWLQNGISISGGDSLTIIPADGDVIFCTMSSNYVCHAGGAAISNNRSITVESSVAPTVTVTAYLGTDNNGVVYNDTLVANVTNGGFAPAYQWSVNGVDIPGATGPTFYSYSLFNNDIVSCKVTNNNLCGAISGSGSVVITAPNNVGVKTVASTGYDVRLVPNPNKGDFTLKGTLGTTDDEEVTIEVSDMLGQVIYKGTLMARGGNIDEKIKLNTTLSNGMYLLNLGSASGSKVFHMVVEQ